MKAQSHSRFINLIIHGGIVILIALPILSLLFFLSSCKALGKAGVVVASIVFLLFGAILIAGMVVVIRIAFRHRGEKMESSDRRLLILWGILLPVLFGFNLIWLPFLQDCLDGQEITQQFIVREIYMNGGRSGTMLIASEEDPEWIDNYDPLSFYDDVYDPDSSIIYFYSGILANITFMRDFFDSADVSITKRDWFMTSTDTQIMYATITYYPRTHAILSYKDVKIIPVEPTE